jgi:hypothetical protein
MILKSGPKDLTSLLASAAVVPARRTCLAITPTENHDVAMQAIASHNEP